MNYIFKALSNAAFTKRCRICGSVIEINKELCDDCFGLEKIGEPYCCFCGCNKDDCTCHKKKNEFSNIAAPYYYDDSIIRAVHNFKSNDMPFLSKGIAESIYDTISSRYGDIVFDYVTFVPLRRFHMRARGYNQSQLIANEISAMLDVPCADMLLKVRYTGVQHHKNEMKRKADLFGAFDVSDKFKPALDGKKILLIDDVKTTGATLNECAKMLKIYGACEVDCAVFAVTRKNKKKHLK